jgi:hypothetical protein
MESLARQIDGQSLGIDALVWGIEDEQSAKMSETTHFIWAGLYF